MLSQMDYMYLNHLPQNPFPLIYADLEEYINKTSVQFLLYKINDDEHINGISGIPILSFILSSETGLLIEINVDIEELNEQSIDNQTDLNTWFMEKCVQQLSHKLVSHDIVENYKSYYKGYIFHDDAIILLFDVAQLELLNQSNGPNEGNETTLQELYIDEIFDDYTTFTKIITLFYTYPELIYISDDTGKTVQIPQIMWGSGLRDPDGEYGNFFYFTKKKILETDKKFAGFVDEGKTSYDIPLAPCTRNSKINCKVIYSGYTDMTEIDGNSKWIFKSKQDFVQIAH